MNSVLRYELDDFGKIGITLEKFSSLQEMDLFMKKFKDSNEVKEYYFDKINEFLKTNPAKEFLKLVNGKENNGYLRGYTKYNNSYVHVPIIFQRKVVSDKDCFKRLRQQLQNRKILNDIYRRKPYLLPPPPTLFLRHELCRVVIHNGSNRIFIKEFIRYIEKMNMEERYFVFRCLCDKCHLLDNDKENNLNLYKILHNEDGYSLVKTKKYHIGNKYTLDYDDDKEDTKEKEIELREYDKDSINKDFVSSFNYSDVEHMLENFDIDEIDRNTNYFDNLEGKGRGK